MPKSRKEAEQMVGELMAPYDSNRPGATAEAFWDWYVIGGRWTGEHDGFDSETDIRNYEVCRICKGTGDRGDYDDEKMRNWHRGCNSCRGTGLSHTWETAPHPGDIMELDKVSDSMTAFAVLVNGEYRETDDTKSLKEYLKRTFKITTGVLVTVDCHD